MTYRVVQWGTGWAGRQAIPGVLDHPDLELVGVYVRSDEKNGKDAGELAGMGPIGIAATNDVDEILALEADCHLYMMMGHRPKAVRAAVAQMAQILEAGQNISQTSIVPLYYPEYCAPEIRDPIAAACEAGGSSCYGTGVYPGVMSDVIPMGLLAGLRAGRPGPGHRDPQLHRVLRRRGGPALRRRRPARRGPEPRPRRWPRAACRSSARASGTWPPTWASRSTRSASPRSRSPPRSSAPRSRASSSSPAPWARCATPPRAGPSGAR